MQAVGNGAGQAVRNRTQEAHNLRCCQEYEKCLMLRLNMFLVEIITFFFFSDLHHQPPHLFQFNLLIISVHFRVVSAGILLWPHQRDHLNIIFKSLLSLFFHSQFRGECESVGCCTLGNTKTATMILIKRCPLRGAFPSLFGDVKTAAQLRYNCLCQRTARKGYTQHWLKVDGLRRRSRRVSRRVFRLGINSQVLVI